MSSPSFDLKQFVSAACHRRPPRKMSELICEWLNKEVGLHRIIEPQNLDTAFCSGHLFAVVFSLKHLLDQESLATFKDHPSPEIAIRNFTKLEPIFRAIGVPLTSTTAYDIIKCKAEHSTPSGVVSTYGYIDFNVHMSNNTGGKSLFFEKEHAFFVERLKAKLSLQMSKQPSHEPRSRSESPVGKYLEPLNADIIRIKDEASKASQRSKLEEVAHQIREFTATVQTNTKPGLNSELAALTDDETQRYLLRLKEMQRDDEKMKKEHAIWLESLFRHHKQLQEDLAKQNQQDLIESYLNQKSREELKFQEYLEGIKQEKVKIIQNYHVKQQEYQAIREQEFQNYLALESAYTEKIKLETENKRQLFHARHLDVVERHKASNHQKHVLFCRKLVDQLIELSVDTSVNKSIHGGAIPEWKMSELKTLFIKGYPLARSYDIPFGKDVVVSTVTNLADETQEGNSIMPDDTLYTAVDELDAEEYDAYQDAKVPWTLKTEQPLANEKLDQILRVISETAQRIEPRNTMPQLSPSALKLVMLGKPMSGKRTLSREIADFCNLVLLDPVAITSQALQLAESTTEELVGCLKAKREIGQQLKQVLASGAKVEDAQMTALLANEIRLVEEKYAGSRGWILVDYPKTYAQAALLEKEITGYEDPKLSKNAKKPGKDAKKKDEKVATVLSFIDLVILLNLDTEVATDRLVARRVDPVSGRVYNLVFDSPIDSEPGIYQRLQEVPTPNIEVQSVAFNENLAGITEWFARFDNLKKFDADKPVGIVRQDIERDLALLIQNKNATSPPRAETEEASTAALSMSAATALLSKSQISEVLHVDTLKFLLRTLRKERNMISWFGYQLQNNFKNYLTRPDTKPALLAQFQKNYELLDEDYLSDADVKAELHQRAEDLKEKLWEICDMRKEQAESERVAVIQKRWFEAHLVLVVNLYVQMMQAELTFHVYNVAIIVGYFKDLQKEPFEIANDAAPGEFNKLTAFTNEDGIFEEMFLKTKQRESISQGKKEDPAKRKRAASAAQAATGTTTAALKKSGAAKKEAEAQPTLSESAVIQSLPHVVKLQQSMDECVKVLGSVIKVHEVSENQDLKQALLAEEQSLLSKLERVQRVGGEHIKAIKDQAQLIFSKMDEWLGQQFQTEVEGVRDIAANIRDCIESETFFVTPSPPPSQQR